MICKHFGECASCTLYKLPYKEQIEQKLHFVKEEFSQFYSGDIAVFTSDEANFRDRAEYRIWHENDKLFYAMNGFGKKEIVKIDECHIVNGKISTLMPKLLKFIEKNETLSHRLFGIEFMSGDRVLVTFIYHKKVDEFWQKEACKLIEKFKILPIGRSRGVRAVIERDFVLQSLNVLDREYRYKVYENSFMQPNGKVNEKMLSWVKDNSKDFGGDLLELYCGHGNFTIPLSENFDKVLATEVSKNSIKSAKENLELNSIRDVRFARLSSEEFVKALNKERVFRRLEGVDLDSYNFSTIFVDPPRAGVDKETLKLMQRFKNIIYISCNPKTLKRDLLMLTKTHKVEKFAIFDQFAYTNHLECGAILLKL